MSYFVYPNQVLEMKTRFEEDAHTNAMQVEVATAELERAQQVPSSCCYVCRRGRRLAMNKSAK